MHKSADRCWDLSEVFDDDQAWSTAMVELEPRVEALGKLAGSLQARSLSEALQSFFDVLQSLQELVTYAFLRADENTRDAASLGMRQRARNLATSFTEATSWLEPELLALPEAELDAALDSIAELAPFRRFIEETMRRGEHTLDPAGEQIVASAGLMADAPRTLHGLLVNAEMPWPSVELADGSAHTLEPATYSRLRGAESRDDRKLVFDTFWATWAKFEQTLGAMLYGHLKSELFYSRVRHYDSGLEMSLDGDPIPTEVYHQLLDSTRRHLPSLHRHLRLKARMLEIDDLGYHDLYVPLTGSSPELDYPSARRTFVASVSPLGEDYVADLESALDSRWMDLDPRPGKRGGAYSAGSVYRTHPYVLMNWTDDAESLQTLAHEFGHALHSHLANRAQPFPTADYSIFIAEVASTFNEALLLDYQLKHARDDREKLFHISTALERIRATFFRQVMFADFELDIHQRSEAGEALTGARFSELYGQLLRDYHGHDEGVLSVDPSVHLEWAYIPHFYSSFYVYQYATSLAAASHLAAQVLNGETGVVERYLEMLASGSSAPAYELLCDAGVDLARPEPYDALIARYESLLDQAEALAG